MSITIPERFAEKMRSDAVNKAFEELKYYIDRIIADREKERGAQNA